MATTIVTKNSSTASAVPTAGQLVQGELAVNVADKRLYTEDNAGAIVELGTNPSTLTVTGEITANGGIALGDNDKATFGDSDDLQIYHDGSNSYIDEQGTGILKLRGSAGIALEKYDSTEQMLTAFHDDAVTLFHNGSSKLATTATGIDVTGTATMDGLTVDGDSTLDAIALTASSSFPATGFSLNANGFLYGMAGSQGFILRSASNSKALLNISAGNDISFYEDTGTTAKLFWDASAESLGIGTSSPAYPLHVWSDTTIARLGGTDTNDTYLNIFKDNASSIIKIQASKAGTGATNVAINPDGGSVGIGTSSPSLENGSGLVVYNATAPRISLKNSTTGTTGLDGVDIAMVSSDAYFFNREAGAVILGTSSFERLRIDSSGNVGIGTSSPNSYAGQTTLNINSAGVARLDLDIGNTMQGFLIAESGYTGLFTPSGSNYLILGTNNTERMRIDSSGNVLAGTSSSNYAVVGSQLGVGGNNYMTRSGANPLLLNRLSSDGAILSLMKDGTTVGSIGTNNGDLYIGTGDTGLRFVDADNNMVPFDTASGPATNGVMDIGSSGARFKDLYLSGVAKLNFINHSETIYPTADASVDIGTSSERYRNLYLSGGVYLGGTGAANHLDDYEEGTWTATPTFAAGTATGATTGKYTKVGDLVCATFNMGGNIGTGSGVFTVTGLPFTCAVTTVASIRTAGIGATSTVLQANVVSGGTTIRFLLAPQSTSLAGAEPTAAEMNSPDFYIQLSVSYHV